MPLFQVSVLRDSMHKLIFPLVPLIVSPYSPLYKLYSTSDNMSSRAARNRDSTAKFIEDNGYRVMPCSRCEQKGLVCKMDGSRSKKCSECVVSGRGCDSSGVPLDSCELSFIVVWIFLLSGLSGSDPKRATSS